MATESVTLHRAGIPVVPFAPAVMAQDITRRYGEGDAAVDALRGVSLSVARGELVAVMGPSGSGKSSLLHILAGLDRPTSGEALIDGVPLSRMDDDDLTLLRREKVGFVFQFFNLLPMLSAEQNVVLPLRLAGGTIDQHWVDQVIGDLGLSDRRAHRPAELSGGQQQRVAIARALVTRPSILFADEPTGNLDSKTGHEILELLRSCVASYGQTILTVTHEPRVSTVADRILLLADGRIVRELDDASSSEVMSAIAALAG
ncbi:MAG TPA: ABC transporter ATP-binding protein [Solirubrobacteraceae bacterium]|nr:ABC transporter ATP-binding protein [Solirubrobacteraceae bacterium]